MRDGSIGNGQYLYLSIAHHKMMKILIIYFSLTTNSEKTARHTKYR